MSAQEQEMFQIALANSKRVIQREEWEVPQAPVFRPTLEEFRDPIAYIGSIRDRAQNFGICKIIPPQVP
jgi:hypothetical protein